MTNEELILKAINQILDRSVRIETRLTKLMDHVDIDTGATKPSWVEGDCADGVVAPSVGVSLEDIALALPEDTGGYFDVYVRGQKLATIMWINKELVHAARARRLVGLIPNLQKKG